MFYLSAVSDGLIYFWSQFNGQAAENDLECYIDAYGESWDTDYKIGDNVHWRHYFDQDSDFESEDVRTIGTSIGFVDSASTAANTEIVAEYNEHKKIIKQTNIGSNDLWYGGIPQATSGIIEWWANASQVNKQLPYYLREDGTVLVNITFHTTGIIYAQNNAAFPTILDPYIADTWYHFKVQWYTDDTFDIWIDNILVADGFVFAAAATQVSGINRIYGRVYDGTSYTDAISSSTTSGNEVADNRIFDYNDSYTREDITDKVENVITSNILHGWRTGTLYSKEVYYNDEVFFQIYDVNSKLGMEADIINRMQFGSLFHYPLLDKNADDLVNESSNTFSADKIHDPTDSTSMLKVILPNVSEADGDLILVDADTKTDTYSPITKNYPDYMMLRDISDLSDSVVIIQANGKCYLDDDKASGDSLDKDVAADKLIMTKPPIPNDIVGVNYFVIKGAMNTDTGERFFKVVDNSGNDKINTFRITNNQLKSQTDVDNYAAKIAAKLISVKEIVIETQGLSFHNMGETFNYKYIDAVYNIPQADYYIIKEDMDYDLAASIIVLSDGLVELSKYAQRYERPENYNDSYAAEIYETDINTVYPGIMPGAGAAFGLGAGGDYGVVLNTNLDFVVSYFFIDTKVDESRGVEIKIFWTRDDANNDTLFGSWSVNRRPIDGSAAWASAGGSVEDFDACVSGRGEHHPISLSTVEADYEYRVFLNLNEVARSMTITSVVVRYYIKREL